MNECFTERRHDGYVYTVKKKGFLMGFKKVFYLSSGENPKMGLL